MDTEEARIELNRRLNILNSQRIRTISKQDLRKGLSNINQRKEVDRFSRDVSNRKIDCLRKLNELDNNFSAFSGESEQDIDLGMFHNPSMNKMRKSKGRGYFW